MRDKDAIILESLYASVLEEAKDYRRQIVKQQAMPEDVAEYLHSFDPTKNSDIYSQWFAIQIKKDPGFQNAEDKLDYIKNNLAPQIASILDWFNSEKNIPIFDYSWREALAKDYRKLLNKSTDKDIVEYLHEFSPEYYFIFTNQIKKFKAFKEATNKIEWFENTFVDGIPKNVKDYLISTVGKNYLWFVLQIKSMKDYRESDDKNSWIQLNIADDISSIVDWLYSNPNQNIWDCQNGEVQREGRTINITGFDRALGKSNEWHLQLQANQGATIGNSLKGPEKRDIIRKYDDGFYWIDHHSLSSTEEASLMGHCGSDSISDLNTGKRANDGTIISLRYLNPETNRISAYVTATVSRELGAWIQCKGRGNSRPKKDFYPYIADILNHLKIYKFFYGSYKPELNFDDSTYYQTVEKYPEMFPNKDEILPKIKASLRARNLKQIFMTMSNGFNSNVERQFMEFDDDDKRAYIEGDYTIGTKKAIDSLTPELKEMYFNKIASNPDRCRTFVKSQIISGIPLEQIEKRFIEGIKRNKSTLDQFISDMIQIYPDFENNSEIMDLIASSPARSREYVIKKLDNKTKTLKQIDPKFTESIGKNETETIKFIGELLLLFKNIDIENDSKILDLIAKSASLSATYIVKLITKQNIKPENVEKRFIDAVSVNQTQADALLNTLFGTTTDFGILPENYLRLLSPITAFKYANYLLDTQKLLINQINPDVIIQLDKSSGKSYEFIDKLITLGQEKLLYKDKRIPDTIRSLVPKILGFVIEGENDQIKKQNLENRLENLEKSDKPKTPTTTQTQTTPKTEPEEDDDEGFDINF